MKLRFTILLLLLFSLNTRAQLNEQERFDVSKNLDIYNSLFNELVMNYVDSIEIEKSINNNINYMLRRLDPYTEFIPEEDMSDFTFMTTGEYGGVGAIISMSEEKIIVREPYEGMPADLAGLRPGDILLEIDGNDLQGKMTSDASELLRGQANTQIKVKYQRPGEKKPKEVLIERKRIHIDPVTYYGVLENNIGYIYLSTFTTESSQDVKAAFLDLKNNHGISSLIIDVRDNGGGVVEDCITMLNLFISKGNTLLTMKGRTPQSERNYRAAQDALDTEMPITVLVNHNSASASEILAGTIQDLDRGVVVGTRTYGKGLVQSTRPLPYNGRLKLTTAKYYIPSGRCIQAIDYAQRDEYGRVSSIPDSLTTIYHTLGGRPVRDGAGILPDYVVEDENTPSLIYYLDGNSIFFDFVVQWREKNKNIASPKEFVLSDDVYEEFKTFALSKDFTYDLQSEKAMQSLKQIMEFEGYWDRASDEFASLEQLLKPDLGRDLELHKEQISKFLSMEIIKHFYYAKGQVAYSLRDDIQLNKAIEILQDKEMYINSLLVKEDSN